MNYKKLIEERKSVRDYKKSKVPQHTLDEILDYGRESEKLVPSIHTEVIIKEKIDVYNQLNEVAGYQGMMIEAPHYLIILSDKEEYYIENTGYLGENLVLKALDLGVNSCWIVFPDSNIVKEKLNIDNSKEVTAIIALGYDGNKRRVIDPPQVGDNYTKTKLRIVNNNVSYRHKIENIVFIERWGNSSDVEDLQRRGLIDALNYARLAPSTFNRQPWRFIIDEDRIILTIRRDSNVIEYEEKIDAGISMLYLKLIVEETLKDLTWYLEKPEKEYNIPENYDIVAYCNI